MTTTPLVVGDTDAFLRAKRLSRPQEQILAEIDGPEVKRDDFWHRRGDVIGAYAEALRRVAASPPPYPDGRFGGRGVVILGGGDYEAGVYVAVKMSRAVGCELPVSVYHRGPDDPISDRVRKLDGVTVTDIRSLGIERRNWGGWQTKLVALIHSPFEEVLCLDADAYPVLDPTFLFGHAPSGWLAWRDVPAGSKHLKWGAYRLPPDRLPPLNGGHYVVRKRDAWPLLQLASWIDDHSDFYYRWQHGDQDSVRAAAHAIRFPLNRIAFNPTIQSGCYLQPTPDGSKTLFVHRHHNKFADPGRFQTPLKYDRTLPSERLAFSFYDEWRTAQGKPCFLPSNYCDSHPRIEKKPSRHLVVTNRDDWWTENARNSVKAAAARWGANLWEFVPPPSPFHPAFDRNLTALAMFPEDRVMVLDADCLIRHDCPDLFEMSEKLDAFVLAVEDAISPQYTQAERDRLRQQVKVHQGKRVAEALGLIWTPAMEKWFCDGFINAGMIVRNMCNSCYNTGVQSADRLCDRFAEIVALRPDRWQDAHYEQAVLNWCLKELFAGKVELIDETFNTIRPKLGLPIMDCFVGHFTNLGDRVDRKKAIGETKWHT